MPLVSSRASLSLLSLILLSLSLTALVLVLVLALVVVVIVVVDDFPVTRGVLQLFLTTTFLFALGTGAPAPALPQSAHLIFLRDCHRKRPTVPLYSVDTVTSRPRRL